jgi:hypothetical protein
LKKGLLVPLFLQLQQELTAGTLVPKRPVHPAGQATLHRGFVGSVEGEIPSTIYSAARSNKNNRKRKL